MRSASSSPEPRNRPWLAALSITAIVIVAMLLTLTPPSTTTAVAGVVVTVVGAGSAAAGTARVLRENRGHRVPWRGSPPVRPRQWDLLTGTGSPMAFYGPVVTARSVDALPGWTPLAVCGLLIAVLYTALALHNRRLATA
ncbi:hypothetical protein [Prescottella subtropica]|uniref:hypothetical protein n=1 Tax=Prescottella subtropica TaxID=2545757 RepID=UPI0010F6E082|nr:hypothetical protein [Prescottella subtropica]